MASSSPAAGSPFEGICYEDSLPLEFRAGPAPASAALAGLNADNFQLLIADASLDEARVPASESKSKGDDDASLVEDIHRLEHKVNVLIQLVAKLVAKDQSLPAATAWRLFADGVEWRAAEAQIPAGSVGLLSMHVSRQFPQPLRLPARVVEGRRDEQGYWQRAVFEGLSPAVSEGLARLIFRHHRRAVAGVRAQPRE